jgi:PAS domain S-box-containing protein
MSMPNYWRKIHNWWQDLPIKLRQSVAVCLPMPCIIGTAIACTILRQQTIEAQIDVARTHEVLATSNSSLISLLHAETGVRGYLITKERTFLEPYNLALSTLNPTLDRLELLVSTSPQQTQQVSSLRQIARSKMNHLKQSIQRLERGEIGTTQATRARLWQGNQSMDRFRNQIGNLKAEENQMLAIRTQWLQNRQQLSVTAIWSGIILGLLGAIVSIRLLGRLATEMSAYNIQLLQSHNLIQTVVANVVDGVIVIDDLGKIETINHAAINMFGYDTDEIIGLYWQELLNKEAEDTQKLLFYEPKIAIDEQEHRQIWQASGLRKNGESFPIEVSINILAVDRDLSTTDRHCGIAIVRDINERQQLAAQLQAKATELATLNHALNNSIHLLHQSNQELDQFAYITAHDLKAPLRAIASLSAWVEEDLDPQISAATRSQIHLLRSRVERMQSMINSLLEYSRVGRSNQKSGTIDIARSIEKILLILEPPATFTIDIATPMPTFDTRWQQLEQVFTHLIDNAIRHHPSKMGVVEISAIDLGDRYEFAIADNGEGIEPEYQSKIYTIFQTLKARDLQENIGAGLAIVKKIVTIEGGTIELESQPGHGSIFRFTWLKQPLYRKNTP